MQVELEHQYGRQETPEMMQGQLAHENFRHNAIRLTLNELIDKMATKQAVKIHELPLVIKYKDVFIIGKPDLIVLHEKQPMMLIEYKFAKSPHIENYQRVQASIYCFLLQKLGFVTHNLHYCVAVASPTCRDCLHLKSVMLSKVKEITPIKDTHILCPACEKGVVKCFTYEYNSTRSKKDIDWALDYWFERRDPVPTKKSWKCRACTYSNKCSYSQHK